MPILRSQEPLTLTNSVVIERLVQENSKAEMK
jgi:hypothetical protein